MRPPPPGGGRVRGFWIEQAHADQPAVVTDALDHVSIELELGDTAAGKSIPPACSSAKATGWSPAWRSRCCWTSAGVIDGIVALQREWGPRRFARLSVGRARGV